MGGTQLCKRTVKSDNDCIRERVTRHVNKTLLLSEFNEDARRWNKKLAIPHIE